MSYDILDKISSPDELKALPRDDIPKLCEEIRQFLVDKVGVTGGHLASNLGIVELTVAMHRVFDSPKDHFIFDVGHQAYVHKILTDRKDRFDTLRKPGGLLGFTQPNESAHDPFGAGHSSTAISAGLGFANADKLSGSDAYTVCIVGDGAYTGGMVHEALNNVDPDLRLIIILNENGMSISTNKGAFASYLSRFRMSRGYVRLKESTISLLKRIPLGGHIATALSRIKHGIKSLIFSTNYFEELGMYYVGTVDGNNYKATEKALLEAKRLGKSVVVHVKTQKGRGYPLAEISPDTFHSVSHSGNVGGAAYHKRFGERLISYAGEDEKIVAVTAAMGIGTGLLEFEKLYPERCFDVGIAEGHALTFSAGLCAAGYKPYTAIYSTFLQRGYDSILHDIALQNLPVKIMIDRAGLAMADGATHHGIFDVSFLSHIPGMSIYAPATYKSLYSIMDRTRSSLTPLAIRYPNADESEAIKAAFSSGGEWGESLVRADFDTSKAPENIIITYGKITENVLLAKTILETEGISVGVVLTECLKPTDELVSFIRTTLTSTKRILFVEEGIKNGGAAMICRDRLFECGYLSDRKMQILAIDDNFASPQEICDLYDFVGLSPEKIAKKMRDMSLSG